VGATPTREIQEKFDMTTLVMAIIHTLDCLRQRREATCRCAAWIAQYPHYCAACIGFGGRTICNYPDEPDEFLECALCLSRGLCPRCGASEATLEDGCPSCGWNDDDHRPFVDDCYCDPGLDPLGDLEDLPY